MIQIQDDLYTQRTLDPNPLVTKGLILANLDDFNLDIAPIFGSNKKLITTKWSDRYGYEFT